MLNTVGKLKKIVLEKDSALNMGSGNLNVFSTPSMIAFVEETCWKSIDGFVEEGFSTVGVNIEIKHLKATAIGREVVCSTKLIEVEGKKLKFEVKVREGEKLVAKGFHERFIVSIDKIMYSTK